MGVKRSERVNQARKSEIRGDVLLADPPAAVLLNGQWHESAIVIDGPVPNEWREEFQKIYQPIPADALLTAVDVHS